MTSDLDGWAGAGLGTLNRQTGRLGGRGKFIDIQYEDGDPRFRVNYQATVILKGALTAEQTELPHRLLSARTCWSPWTST